jgi:acyl carrier protein
MHTANIEHEIHNFIVENFLFGKADELRQDDSLLAKGVIDSTGVLELVTFLQEHFAITVEDEEVIPDNLDSIKYLVAFVSRKLNVKV